MASIKKYNDGEWEVAASGDSSGISVTDPELLNEEESVISVEEALKRQKGDIETLKRNVSWLALHGGGGGGWGPGGGSSSSEASCTLYLNNIASGGEVVVDERSGLTIRLADLKAEHQKNWTVTVMIAGQIVVNTTASYLNPTIYIALSKFKHLLTNHVGNISVGASYSDESNGIYGSATWMGSIIEGNVVFTGPYEISYPFEDLKTGQTVVQYEYSVGILGKYLLKFNVTKGGRSQNSFQEELDIRSSENIVWRQNLNTLLGVKSGDSLSELEAQGNYIVEATLQNVENPNISAVVRSSITIQSNTIFVSSLVLSSDIDNPTQVSISSSLNVTFTAFLQNINDFRYDYLVDGVIIKENGIGYFGTAVNDSISLTNKDWVVVGKLIKFTIRIKTSGQVKDTDFYIKFTESISSFLEQEDDVLARMITDFAAYNYDDNVSSFTLTNNVYSPSGSLVSPISCNLRTYNSNSLSVISSINSQKFLRLSNGAYGSLRNWNYSTSINTPLSKMLETGAFTLSFVFKADYHPDDKRTIFFSGDVDRTTQEITTGISIDVHDIYINNSSRVKLTDNTINYIDITCERATAEDTTSSGTVTNTYYIIKIYQDGVLSSVSSLSQLPQFGSELYIGARVYMGIDGQEVINQCDCDIYSIKIYDKALDELELLTNYINALAYTDYRDGNPNFDRIPIELKKNFCERTESNKLTSLLYQNGQYSINFLIDPTTQLLSKDSLNDYAKILGIPIMMIDVYNDENWTFNNFKNQQTAGAVTLKKSEGRNIYYWDPTRNNQTVLTIEDATIELQGTSTLSDAVKNLNITIPDDAVFVPKETWFPEQTYTLKADVVDSSHSNNAAIGNFINTVFGYQEEDTEYGAKGSSYFPFDPTAISNVYESDYKQKQQKTVTLKHTVEGFPVLLIMKFHTDEAQGSTVSITPLGIYSFNIGRNAYRNLGFRKLNSITDRESGVAPEINTFPYYAKNMSFNETNSNANWIEINDTIALKDIINLNLDNQSGTSISFPDNFDSASGDFWQNDDNILNTRYSVRFGESGKTQVSEYPKFKNFIEYIMQLPVEGIFATPSNIGSSGDLIRQEITGAYDLYTYVQEGQNYIYKKTGRKQNITSDVNTIAACPFNEESVYKYFVIALLFGLVDNFGKNSTFRSWGSQTSDSTKYYIDFYDMDTALGGSNQGQLDIFPDCWIKYFYNKGNDDYGYMIETFNPDQEGSSRTVVSANHNKLWLSLDTNFYRKRNDSTASLKSIYTQYWYNLRSYLDKIANTRNYDSFYEWFINDFFIRQTGDCGPLLFNYDYKLKYLLQFSPTDLISTRDLPKLHGRKISYSRDWLKKHIIFLDSIFYWRDNTQTPNFKTNVSQQGSNRIKRTPVKFPMASNTPIAMYYTIGNSVQTFAFLQQNTETYIDSGNNASDSDIMWTFTNSPNIITLGNETTPLSQMNVSTLNFSTSGAGLDTSGYPAVTSLNLSNNRTFSQEFSMSAFEQGIISEIRKLDFSRTATNTGSKFSLSLVNTTTEGVTYTKYNKLTSIDISSSTAISSLTIPNVPLINLEVRNSAITEFVLERQQYIADTDLSGCTSLQRVILRECPSFTRFNISKMQNLSRIEISNCSGITEINISDCPVLQRVYISGNTSLKKVTITGCKNLRKGNDYEDAIIFTNGNTALEEVNLSNNINLDTFIFNDSNIDKIKRLDLSNTSITHLREDTTNSENVEKLNLVKFKGLEYFAIYNNSQVKTIQFANVQSRPIPITNTFQGCINLERIYGNLEFTGALTNGQYGLFYGLSKFTLHGNISSFLGRSIKDVSRIRTVWEILSGQDNPTDSTAFERYTLSDIFQPGNGEYGISVTNISFNKTGTNLLYNLFYGTSVTQFDIYYTLAAFGLSQVTNTQSLNATFARLNSTSKFSWDSKISRWMFYKCEKITQLQSCFSVEGTIILPSPDEGRDNGLLSPLVNLNRIYSPWGQPLVITRRFFRRYDGKDYPINYMYSFNTVQICENDNDFTSTASVTNNTYINGISNKIGSFEGFWNNTPNIDTLHSCFSPNYLDLETLHLPDSLENIINCFNPSYCKGELKLGDIFSPDSECKYLVTSFKISSICPFEGNGWEKEPTRFEIDDNTFKNLRKLEYIGSCDDNPGWLSVPETATSFTGSGYNKVFKDKTFPDKIVSHLRNLKCFCGFFQGVSNEKLLSIPKIPGDMFKNCPELRYTSQLFRNCGFEFQLSGKGFENCTNIQNLYYMFADNPQLSGYVPYQLLYHGKMKTTRRVYGLNGEEKPSDSTPIESINSQNIEIDILNTSIRSVRGLFYGCTGLSPYNDKSKYQELNEEYNPYDWIYDVDSRIWNKNTEANKCRYDYSWGYNGYPEDKITSNAKYLENNKVEIVGEGKDRVETLYYMCSPDLFRYCYNSNSTNITEVFCNCGQEYYYNDDTSLPGIYGRIPPYLLKPIPSVTDISRFFRYCRKLSSVKIEEVIYQIPPDFFNYAYNVTMLEETFKGLNFVNGTSLNIFGPLSGALTVTAIFNWCNYLGSSNWEISNIFSSNNIARCSGAFCAFLATPDASNSLGISVNINDSSGSIIPKSNITFRNNFPSESSKMPSPANIGYVYYGIGGAPQVEESSTIPVTNNNFYKKP